MQAYLHVPRPCHSHVSLASYPSTDNFSPLIDVQNPAGLAEAPPLLETAEARAMQGNAGAPPTEEEEDDYYKNCSFSQVMGHAQGRNDL